MTRTNTFESTAGLFLWINVRLLFWQLFTHSTFNCKELWPLHLYQQCLLQVGYRLNSFAPGLPSL